MEKVYANLKDLIKNKIGWKILNENKHFDMEDLVIRGSTWDSIWVRVVGNDHEAMEYLYKIMDSEKRFIRFIVETPISKRTRIYRDGRVILENEGYLEIDARTNVIMINEYNKLGEQEGDIVMSWKTYEVMKEYLENLKKRLCD